MSEIFSRVEGTGRPIILIHGFCENLKIWDGFTFLLADSNQVFLIDLPGFGNSQLPSPPFTIDTIAKLVIEWMDENKIENPILVGHSLGGYVALSMCEQAPEKILALVLFHSTAYPDSDEKKVNRNKVIEFVKTHGVAPFVDTFVPGLFKDKNHPSISKVDQIARATKLKTLIAYSQAMRNRPSRVDFLKSFDRPFLVVGGKWDQTIPPNVSEELGALGKNSFTIILAGTAHMGMFEQPIDAARVIKDFIANLN